MTPWEQRWAARTQVARGPADAGLFLALAPMDGVTDAVFRDLMTGLFGGRSGISLCVSEFVRVTQQPAPTGEVLQNLFMIVNPGPKLRIGRALNLERNKVDSVTENTGGMKNGLQLGGSSFEVLRLAIPGPSTLSVLV